MKLTLIILFLTIVVKSEAQIKVKSTFGTDSIVLCAQCIEIRGIGVTAKNDSARSVYWIMGGFGRDISSFSLITNYYDKNGNFLTNVSGIVQGVQLPNLILVKSKIDSLMKVTQPRIQTQ